jgi:hypothetical protein
VLGQFLAMPSQLDHEPRGDVWRPYDAEQRARVNARWNGA